MLGQTDYVGSSDGGNVATVAAVWLFAATERVVPRLFGNETRDAGSPTTRMCKDQSLAM